MGPSTFRSSTASTNGSTFRTIPAPPPYGASSTVWCLSCVWSRSCTTRNSTNPAACARPNMLEASGAVNQSGNSVTTLMLSIATHPPRLAGHATLRRPRATSRLRTRATTRGGRHGAESRPAVRPAPHALRSGRTVALSARTRSLDFRRGGPPPPRPAGRAACAAARLRGGRSRRSCRFAQYAGLLEQRTHRISRHRALLEPGARLLGVHVDHRRIGVGVVVADRRHKALIAGRLRVLDHDAEIGLTLPPYPAQPNSSCHCPTSFS